jgi:CBS domain-containing protein
MTTTQTLATQTLATQTLETNAANGYAGPTARDLMSPVDSVITEEATLREAIRRFLDGPGRHLIVLDRDGRCAGVIGPRHVAQAHRLDLRRDEEIPVSELCGAPWIALSPLDSLRTCAQMLVEYDLDAIPVLDGDKRVLGLVTAHDIVRATADVPPHQHPRWRD